MSYLSAATSLSKSESSAAHGPTAPLRSHFDDHSTINVAAVPALAASSATPFAASADAAARRPASRRSRRSQREIPTPVRVAAGLAAFLPLPPLVSVLYLACGHAILRSTHPAHYSAPLVSSARAGAVGGAILALPLAVLGYLLLFPTKPPDPDDFFDDDDEGEGVWEEAVVVGTYVLCGALLLTLGAISGALGTVCLPSSIMLSAAEAAAAGILGAVVLLSALALVVGCAFLLWLLLWRRHQKDTTTAKETQ